MGGIGSAVAQRAKAFGMKIQYHNRRQLPAEKENGAKYVSFEDLLKTSDVLSLNLGILAAHYSNQIFVLDSPTQKNNLISSLHSQLCPPM